MEKRQLGDARSDCSNCTFMELKFASETLKEMETYVLIVPLWN